MSNTHHTTLTSEEIIEFAEIGWITKKELFNPDEVVKMRDCFDRLEQLAKTLSVTGLCRGSHFVLGEKNGRQVIKRVVWAGGSQPYLLAIGNDRRLTGPCSQLLQSKEMDQLLSQAHFKRPGDGVIFDWHQDIQHRDKGPGTWTDVNGNGSFIQTLVVLDEMNDDSGPMLFAPGSSQWGAVDFGEHEYDDPNYTPKKPPQFHDGEAVVITAQPGDTLFFGPYTAHASFENTSGRYRRVLINGYACPGANHRIYPGDGAGRKVKVD